MLDVIQKLEAAVEGSDALDREIAKECGIEWSPDEDGNYGGYNILPRRCWFSRSVDAALTLVPEGWWVEELHQFEAGGPWIVEIETDGAWRDCDGPSPTAAIGLCIVALKARSS